MSIKFGSICKDKLSSAGSSLSTGSVLRSANSGKSHGVKATIVCRIIAMRFRVSSTNHLVSLDSLASAFRPRCSSKEVSSNSSTAFSQFSLVICFAKAEHLKHQANDLSRSAMSSDLKDIMDSLLGLHQAGLEEKRYKLEQAAHRAGMLSDFAGGLAGAGKNNKGLTP